MAHVGEACAVRHADHVRLIGEAVKPGETWADLGSGEGAFTLALADLLGANGTIYSIERDADALDQQREAMERRFPNAKVEYMRADFTRPLELPPLDGIVMANSLHFIRTKEPVLERLLAHLKDDGRFVLVEYDADSGNTWVPHPLSYSSWEKLAARAGLKDTRLIGRVPSRFLGAIYSALSVR